MSLRLPCALVVSGGGFAGLGIVKGLQEDSGLRILLADLYKENVTRYFVDRAFTVPPISQKAEFLSVIHGICDRERVGLIFPSTDRELELFSSELPELERKGIRCAVSRLPLLGRLRHKKQMLEFLAQAGLPVAPCLAPFDFSRGPVIGKPVHGWGSQGILRAASESDLATHPRGALEQDYVWQPLLSDFEEISADFAIGFDSVPSPAIMRSRCRVSGGFAVVSESADVPIANEFMRKLITQLAAEGGMGIFNVQFLISDGKIQFTDLNPRIGTSAVFAQGADVNLPLFVARSAFSESLPCPAPAKGNKKMIRFLEERWVPRSKAAGIRALAFDLDDTLIDQKAWIASKLEAMHGRFAQVLPEKAAFLALAFSILEEGNRSKLLHEVGAALGLGEERILQMIRAYRECEPKGTALYADVLPVLEELRARGFGLALITDNPPASQAQKLRAHGLSGRFDAVIFTRETGSEKPAKDGFLAAAKALALRPSQIAMVGDHPYRDLTGALEAGFGAAYRIRRIGALFNFSDSLLRQANSKVAESPVMNSLRELFWHLPDAPTANG